jgi:hypothetical protein
MSQVTASTSDTSDPLPSVEELQPAKTIPTEESEVPTLLERLVGVKPNVVQLALLEKYYPVQYEFWMRRIK